MYSATGLQKPKKETEAEHSTAELKKPKREPEAIHGAQGVKVKSESVAESTSLARKCKSNVTRESICS